MPNSLGNVRLGPAMTVDRDGGGSMRWATGALALLALGMGATATASQNAIPQGFTVAARSDLYAGVEYMKLTNGTPVVADVAHVVPGAWVDLKVVNAGDKLSTAPT